MSNFSVPGYNIYDMHGKVLHDGDIVRLCWGGGNDGRRYKRYAYHRLHISKRGKLRLADCSNIVVPRDLEYQSNFPHDDIELGARFKEYY